MNLVDPTGKEIVVHVSVNNNDTVFKWTEVDGMWGFYTDVNNIKELYSGSDDYVKALTNALSTLMEGKMSSAMIKEIVKSPQQILVNENGSNSYDPSKK